MLNAFDPRELRLPPRSTFHPRDIASLGQIYNAALRVANECLSEYETHGSPGKLGFTSEVGWAPQGEPLQHFGNGNVVIGLKTKSNRYHWSHRCVLLGYRVRGRRKSKA